MLLLVATATALAWREGSPLVPQDAGRADPGGAPLFLALLIAAFAAYLGGLWLVRRVGGSLRPVVALAIVIQLVPLAAPLLLSTDAWTYWEYGLLANDGDDPYATPPERRPENPAYAFAGADWRDTTSVYGPVFTGASQAVAALAGDSEDAAAWFFKALAACSAVACVLLAARLGRDRAFAAAFVGWNPLLAVHLAGGGHNDGWLAALGLGALALGAAGRRRLGGAVWSLAVFVKWIPAVFAGLLALEARGRRPRLGLLGLVAAAVVIAGLATWRFGADWLGALGPLAANAGTETSYALPHRLEQLGAPDALALAAALVALATGIVWLARESWRGRARLAPAAVLLLVTTPWLAVWYLAWPVALAAVEDDDRSRVAVLALCAYLLPQAVPL